MRHVTPTLSRRRFLRGFGLGAAAVGTGTAAAEWVRGAGRAAAAVGNDTLVVAQDVNVQTLDPQIVYNNTLRITRGMYEGLLGLRGSTAQIVPRLATSWQGAPDASAWTFHLRQGVRFHDGTPFTSEAVRVSMERLLKINRGFAYAFKDEIAKIETPDAATVRFALTGPDAAFLAKLAAVSGVLMVSPAAVRARASGDDLAQGWLGSHGAGTGPYMLESYDKGANRVVLTRFPGYWGGWSGPHLTRFIFTTVPEASTQRLMLEQGDADLLTVVAPDTIDALAKQPGIKVESSPTARIFYIAMNCQREPLRDVKVRQALSYAFNYEAANALIFNGQLEALNGPLPNSDPSHLDPADKPYRFDLPRARQLLSESSHPNGGFTLTCFISQGDPTYQKAAQILQEQLKALNIGVNIQELVSSVMLDKAGKLETAPDLMPIRNYPDYADPSAMILGTFGKAAWGGAGWNFSFYANDRVEQLLKQAGGITSQVRRLQMFKEAERIIVGEAPAILIGTLVNRAVMRANVQHYTYNPFLGNTFDLYAVSKS